MATRLAEAVQATVAAYAERIPLPTCPQCENAEARESVIRQWTYGLAEQVAFSHPGEGWGTKRATAGRPISKDTITQKVGDALTSYDIVSGAGTASPTLHINATAIDTTGQVFVDVTPVDHINSASGGSTGETEGSTPGGVTLEVLASRLSASEAKILQLQGTVETLATVVSKLTSIFERCITVDQVRTVKVSTNRKLYHAHETELQVIDLPKTESAG